MNIDLIWSQYRSSLKAFLHTKVADPIEVEDLLQEILIKTYQNLDTVKSQSSLKAWLFQIAHHAIIDFYRRHNRAIQLSPEDMWFNQDNDHIEQQLADCVEPFINALPESSAQLLREIDLHGQSQKDYANQLGISYSTLKSRVQKARHQLRKLFEDCCTFSVDSRGNLIDFDKKSTSCKKC